MRSLHNLTRTRRVSVFILAGTMAGLAAALGWRYAVPRRLFDASPPPPSSNGTDTGYFIVNFDYLQYVSGPQWWPIPLLLPLIGATLGAVAWLLSTTLNLSTRKIDDKVAAAWDWTLILASGAVTGVISARLASTSPPEIWMRPVKDPLFTDYEKILNASEEYVAGAPPHLNLGIPYLVLPALGAATALLTAVLLTFVLQQRNSPHSDAEPTG